LTVDELALALVDIPSVSGHEQAITRWIGGRVAAMPPCQLVVPTDRKSQVEGRPRPNVGRSAESSAVSLDDRAADRQSHSQPRGFGGEERIEDPVL